MVAERAGECFVRAVIRIQRQVEDIGRAFRECSRRFAQAPGTHVTHDRQPRRGGESPHHVETRDASDACDLIERQLVSEVAFDKPERLLGRIHGSWPHSKRCIMIASRALRLTVLALVKSLATGTGCNAAAGSSAVRKIAAKRCWQHHPNRAY